jgi:crotonobetainyl-CoA:carnitine CoA-transferase CaiB-like acyl-CoA transferase
MARGPLWIDGRPTSIQRAAPLLGEHSEQILREHGFSEHAINLLVDANVIRTGPGTAPG